MNNSKKLLLIACGGLFLPCTAMANASNDRGEVSTKNNQVPLTGPTDLHAEIEIFGRLSARLQILACYCEWLSNYDLSWQLPAGYLKELKKLQKEILELAEDYEKKGHSPLTSSYFQGAEDRLFSTISQFWPVSDKQSIIYRLINASRERSPKLFPTVDARKATSKSPTKHIDD